MNTNILKTMLLAVLVSFTSANVLAAEYKLDPTHSFVNFKISHLGISWLLGRFNDVSGDFSYDSSKPEATKISILIDTTTYDSNHSERNLHIKDEKYLDVEQYPEARFVSTGFTGDKMVGILSGKLTLHGVTKNISFDIKKVGEGKDPWGGYRAGFEGSVVIKRTDFGMESNLGPLANEVYLDLFIEGVRKK
ncbi:MAG: YceI family protein [Pseudomonadales bacterium]